MEKQMEAYTFFRERAQELEQDLLERGQAVADFQPGWLEISHRNHTTQYFWCHDGRKEYLSAKRKDFVKELAQQSYDRSVIKSEQKELAVLKRFLSRYEVLTLRERIYYSLSPDRQKLIRPVVMSDDDYVVWWKNIPFEGKSKESGPMYETEQGERVRSKSELTIANMLYAAGVPYKYECPLRLSNGKRIYPDFTILDVKSRTEYYWEHFGMMDYDKYYQDFLWKMDQYEASGLLAEGKLITTFESNGHPLSTRAVDLRIKRFLEQ